MVERIEQYIKLTEERMKKQVKKDESGKLISEPLTMYKVHEMAMMWMMNDLAEASNERDKKIDFIMNTAKGDIHFHPEDKVEQHSLQNIYDIWQKKEESTEEDQSTDKGEEATSR